MLSLWKETRIPSGGGRSSLLAEANTFGGLSKKRLSPPRTATWADDWDAVAGGGRGWLSSHPSGSRGRPPSPSPPPRARQAGQGCWLRLRLRRPKEHASSKASRTSSPPSIVQWYSATTSGQYGSLKMRRRSPETAKDAVLLQPVTS